MQHHLLLSHWSDSISVQAILHHHLTKVQLHFLFATYALVIWFMIQTYAFVAQYDMPTCPNLQCPTKPTKPQWCLCEASGTDISPHKVTVKWKLVYLNIEPKNNPDFLLTLNTILLLNYPDDAKIFSVPFQFDIGGLIRRRWFFTWDEHIPTALTALNLA